MVHSSRVRFRSSLEQASAIRSALVLEPVQLVSNAEIALEVRGRNNGHEIRGVLQLLLDLLFEVDAWPNTIVEPYIRATRQKGIQFFR